MQKWHAFPLLAAGTLAAAIAILSLLHTPSAGIEWLAATGLALFLASLCLLINLIRLPRQQMTLTPRDSLHLLQPRLSPGQQRQNALLLLLTLSLPFVFFSIHAEATHAEPLRFSHMLALAAAALLLWLAIRCARTFWRTRNIPTIQIALSTPTPHMDDPLTIHFLLATTTPSPTLDVRLVCIEHALLHIGRYVHLAVRPKHELTLQLAPSQNTHAATVIVDSIQFPPSGQWGNTMYPFYHWEIQVRHATMTITYPLTITRRAK